MKRSFVLLEAVIAVALLAMLAGFLFVSPFRSLKEQLKSLLELETERAWDVKVWEIEQTLPYTYAQIEEKKGPWQKWEKAFVLGGKSFTVTKEYRLYVDNKSPDGKSFLFALDERKKKGSEAFEHKFFWKKSRNG